MCSLYRQSRLSLDCVFQDAAQAIKLAFVPYTFMSKDVGGLRPSSELQQQPTGSPSLDINGDCTPILNTRANKLTVSDAPALLQLPRPVVGVQGAEIHAT